jgi:hypothetical protein
MRVRARQAGFDAATVKPAASVAARDVLQTVNAAMTIVVPLESGPVLLVDLDRPAAGGGLESRLSWAGQSDPLVVGRGDVLAGGSHEVQVDVMHGAISVQLDGRPFLLQTVPVDGGTPSRVEALAGLVVAAPTSIEEWEAIPFLPRGESSGGPSMDGRDASRPPPPEEDSGGMPPRESTDAPSGDGMSRPPRDGMGGRPREGSGGMRPGGSPPTGGRPR